MTSMRPLLFSRWGGWTNRSRPPSQISWSKTNFQTEEAQVFGIKRHSHGRMPTLEVRAWIVATGAHQPLGAFVGDELLLGVDAMARDAFRERGIIAHEFCFRGNPTR